MENRRTIDVKTKSMSRKPKKPADDDSTQNRLTGPPSPTSTGLLIRIRGGDPIAWSHFFKIYSPLVRHWCKKPGGMLTRPDRQDITQEVLAKVSKSIEEFDEKREGRSFRAWLRTITQCTIADHLKKIEKRKDVSRMMSDTGHIKEPYNKPFELTEDPDEKTILMRQVIKAVRAEFSDKQWEVIDLIVFAEKNSFETAGILGKTPTAVRKIKSRIMKRIREEYIALGIDEDLPEKGG